MHLTSEQFEAAQARGCQFQPASQAQIRQMAMQRRIFWLGDQAFTAQRSDGFYETAATLQKLLIEEEEGAEAPPAPAAAREAASAADDPPPAEAQGPADAPVVAEAEELAAPVAPPAEPTPLFGVPEASAPAQRIPTERQRRRTVPAQPELELVPGTGPEQQPEPLALPQAGQPAAPPGIAAPMDEPELMQCVVTIIGGYARHNAMGAAELSVLIANVHDTLSGLLHAEEEPVPRPVAAPFGPARRRRRGKAA